jgi:uncharacterized GH25 family protein
MNTKSSLLAALLVAMVSLPAWAHFIFVATGPNAAGKPAVHLIFGEDAILGEANLLDRVAHAKLWVHEAGKAPVEVKLEKEVKGEHGTWTAPVDLTGKAFTASCEYGVLSRGEKKYLLNYHAKNLNAIDPVSLKTFGRTENLKLDIVPTITGEQGELQVLFDGKPAANAQVMIWTPDKYEKETEQFTDADGKVKFKVNQKGIWTVRARHQHDQAGERDGKAYPYEMHYSTLVLKNGEPKAEEASK